MKKVFLIVPGIILGLLLSFAFDRLLGSFRYSFGLINAMTPGSREVYDTAEFEIESKISSQGIRNGEVAIPKPKGRLRILAVGDSFTYGWGVPLEDTWVKLLEKALKEKNENLEIINAGVPGLDPRSAVKICRNYRNKFDADGIIYGFYPLDDLYQLWSQNAQSKVLNINNQSLWPNMGNLVAETMDKMKSGGKKADKLVSTDIWKNMAKDLSREYPKLLPSLDPEARTLFLTGKIDAVFVGYSQADHSYFTRILDRDYSAETSALFANTLDSLKKECAGNLPFYLVVIPPNEMVNKESFPYRKKIGLEVSDNLLTLDLDSDLAPLARARSFEYISLVEPFRKDGCSDCYYHWDPHLTKAGNLKVAQFLKDKIKFPGLIY